MIKRIGEGTAVTSVRMADARYPAPFASGLEYAAPARGTWNIVHVGMLIPEAHQIFVCAQGCLRGVVLTAAEMGESERFSTIAVRENNLLNGDMEWLIIDGVTDILEKLEKLPPAVLVYTSCVHHFMACDLDMVYRSLRERFPTVRFTDCYMNPIMRKSGLTPDQLMRSRLYSFLEPSPERQDVVSILGNDFPLESTNELYTWLAEEKIELREIQRCKSFEDYLKLAESSLYITTYPSAVAGAKELANRLGAKHIHIPVSFDYDEIEQGYSKLGELLGISAPDCTEYRKRCEKTLGILKEKFGDTPIVIDYTAFSRPLSLAKLLLKHGFCVTSVFADTFTGEEQKDFEELKALAPELVIYPTGNHNMRVAERKTDEKTVAIGQKAAYFCGTDHFVNVVENGGFLGFDGILRLCALLNDAYDNHKDAKALIQIKGMGCGCCQ